MKTIKEAYTYGRIDPDLSIECQDVTFHVHRKILSLSSPVLHAMLEGDFAESGKRTIAFEGDDWRAWKWSLDIMYAGLMGNFNYGDMSIPKAELELVRIFVEKYDMIGVVGFMNYLASSQERRFKSVQEIKRLTYALKRADDEIERVEDQAKDEIKRVNDQLNRFKFRSGAVVDYSDKPPIGTRVKGNNPDKSYNNKRGTIIANDEDNGTEIGVRWDDGTESHNIWCCKKGGRYLLYG